MNTTDARTADDMRKEVVAYFDNEIDALDRASTAAGRNMGVKERESARLRRLALVRHRDFFAALFINDDGASDREVSIGKHAFDTGYNSAAQRAVDFAPTVVRDWAAHREAAWSDYTPPDFE